MKLSLILLLGAGGWVASLPTDNVEAARSMDGIAWPESYAEKREEAQARSMDGIAWPESYAEKREEAQARSMDGIAWPESYADK